MSHLLQREGLVVGAVATRAGLNQLHQAKLKKSYIVLRLSHLAFEEDL